VSLRARFLALFAVPAVVPPAAVGIFDCVHSMRALEDLDAEQVAQIPDRSVSVLQERPERFWAKSDANLRKLFPPVPCTCVEHEKGYRSWVSVRPHPAYTTSRCA
jgi:hypothetical protein